MPSVLEDGNAAEFAYDTRQGFPVLKRLAFLVAAVLLTFASAAVAQPVVSFTASSYSVPEKNKVAYVRVQRTGDGNAAVGCTISVTNLATNNSFSVFMNFAKGEFASDVFISWDIQDLDDKYYNVPPRKYHAVIVAVNGGSIGNPFTTDLDVVDDEPQPQLTIADTSAPEGDGIPHTRALFTLRLTTPRSTYTGISITVHDGTAKNGIDYNFPYPSVFMEIPPNQLTAEFPIEVLPDNIPEGDETFTVEITTGAPGVTVVKSISTCTIVDDDDAVSPLSQRIAKGSKGVIHISLGDPATVPEIVQLLTLESFLSVPSLVLIPAGSNSADVEISTSGVGGGAVLITLPPSRGGRVYSCNVYVFEPVTVTLDPVVVSLAVGASANVKVKVDPPPTSSVSLRMTQTVASVADVPASAALDVTGIAAIPVRALAAGITTVSVVLPEPLGDIGGRTSIDFVVVASLPSGLAITSLSQKTGRTSGGESIKLFGTNFTPPCTVTFGGVPAQTADAPANGAIAVTTPPHDAGVVDVGIRCGSNAFTLPSSFTYTATSLTIASVVPASGGSRGGTIVNVRGANLHTGACTARFGSATAHTIAWNGNASITVITPPHTAAHVPVTLTCGNETAALASGFNYVEPDDVPALISAAVPLRAAPGDHFSLTGARFRADDTILFDNIAVSDDAPLAAEFHTVTVPELPPGIVTLSLRDVAGRTAIGPKIEIIAPPTPTLTQIAARLTVGAEFAITGTSLRRALTFGLGPAIVQPISITTTRAIFRVPSSVSAGPTSFTISDRGATLLSRPVDVTTSGLGVASIAPPCSVREGGTLATIFGTGFENGATVQFGTTDSAAVTFRDRFTLTATVPPAFAGDAQTITVTNPNGTTATLTNTFAYRSAAEGGCTSRRRPAGH